MCSDIEASQLHESLNEVGACLYFLDRSLLLLPEDMGEFMLG